MRFPKFFPEFSADIAFAIINHKQAMNEKSDNRLLNGGHGHPSDLTDISRGKHLLSTESQTDPLMNRNPNPEESRNQAKRVPTPVLEHIRSAALSLPESARGEFTRNCLAKTKDLIFDHTNTFFWAGLGYVAGILINHLTSFNILGWQGSLSLGRADEFGALGGGFLGFLSDRKAITTRNRMAQMIREEFHRAKNPAE